MLLRCESLEPPMSQLGVRLGHSATLARCPAESGHGVICEYRLGHRRPVPKVQSGDCRHSRNGRYGILRARAIRSA